MKSGHVRPSDPALRIPRDPRSPEPIVLSDLGERANPRSKRPNYEANCAARKAQPKHHPWSDK